MERTYFTYIIIVFLSIIMPNWSLASIDTSLFVTNPILSRPTDKSITIGIVPKKIMQIYYEYGISSSVYLNQSEIKTIAAGVPISFVINNLLPNTRYYYRLRYKEMSADAYSAVGEYTFITQRAKGSTFIFTVEADPHLYDKKGGHTLIKIAVSNELKDNPDFILDLGDTFGDDHNPTTITQQEMMQLHLNFLPYIGLACHSAPFFFCVGNHEGESGYYLIQTPPENIAVYGTLARKYYYSNPAPDGFYTGNSTSENYGIGLPENYYAWEWGDALFVVLDAYRGYTANSKPREWEWTLGEAQYNWFKQTLENSHTKYKFVFAHHILGETRGGVSVAKYYEWGGYEANGTTWGFTANRPGWPATIHQLMVNNRVNIFFQGHDHLYAKEMLDGIVYQEVPMPSDSTYIIGTRDNGDAYSGVVLDGSGHLRVTISPSNVTVDYVRALQPADETPLVKNDEVVYSYSVLSKATAVEPENQLPAVYVLNQNYPNPFNPATNISFALPAEGFVTLEIYNSLGQEVETIVNSTLSAGKYSYVWNAANIASGVYFYQLRVGALVLSKKAILLK